MSQPTTVAISGSPSHQSTSLRLLAHAVEGCARNGVPGAVVDHARRSRLASVGALVVPAGIYGTDGQFGPDGPEPALLARVDRAVSKTLEVIGHVAL